MENSLLATIEWLTINIRPLIGEKAPTCKTINELAWQIEKLSNAFNNPSLMKNLMELYQLYINVISIYSLSETDPDTNTLKHEVFKYMTALNALNIKSVPGLAKAFIENAIPLVTSILSDPSLIDICGIELLRFFNNAVRSIDKSVRHEVCSTSTFFVYKLVDVLSVCGCYEYQMLTLETIFQVCSLQKVKDLSANMFPRLLSLQHAIKNVDIKEFDNSARTFLNIVNNIYGNIMSVIADKVYLDDLQVQQPLDAKGNQQPLWIDFNKNSVSFFQAVNWELITIFYKDIENIVFTTSTRTSSQSTIFKFFLINDFHILSASPSHVISCKVVSFIFYDAVFVKKMNNDILPYIAKVQQLQPTCSDGSDSSSLVLSTSVQFSGFSKRAPSAKSVRSSNLQSEKSLYNLFRVDYRDAKNRISSSGHPRTKKQPFSKSPILPDSTVDDKLLSAKLQSGNSRLSSWSSSCRMECIIETRESTTDTSESATNASESTTDVNDETDSNKENNVVGRASEQKIPAMSKATMMRGISQNFNPAPKQLKEIETTAVEETGGRIRKGQMQEVLSDSDGFEPENTTEERRIGRNYKFDLGNVPTDQLYSDAIQEFGKCNPAIDLDGPLELLDDQQSESTDTTYVSSVSFKINHYVSTPLTEIIELSDNEDVNVRKELSPKNTKKIPIDKNKRTKKDDEEIKSTQIDKENVRGDEIKSVSDEEKVTAHESDQMHSLRGTTTAISERKNPQGRRKPRKDSNAPEAGRTIETRSRKNRNKEIEITEIADCPIRDDSLENTNKHVKQKIAVSKKIEVVTITEDDMDYTEQVHNSPKSQVIDKIAKGKNSTRKKQSKTVKQPSKKDKTVPGEEIDSDKVENDTKWNGKIEEYNTNQDNLNVEEPIQTFDKNIENESQIVHIGQQILSGENENLSEKAVVGELEINDVEIDLLQNIEKSDRSLENRDNGVEQVSNFNNDQVNGEKSPSGSQQNVEIGENKEIHKETANKVQHRSEEIFSETEEVKNVKPRKGRKKGKPKTSKKNKKKNIRSTRSTRKNVLSSESGPEKQLKETKKVSQVIPKGPPEETKPLPDEEIPMQPIEGKQFGHLSETDDDVIEGTPVELVSRCYSQLSGTSTVPVQEVQQKENNQLPVDQLNADQEQFVKKPDEYQVILSDGEHEELDTTKKKRPVKKESDFAIVEDKIKKYFDPNYHRTLTYLHCVDKQIEPMETTEKAKLERVDCHQPVVEPVRQYTKPILRAKRKLYNPNTENDLNVDFKNDGASVTKDSSDDSSSVGKPEVITVQAMIHEPPTERIEEQVPPKEQNLILDIAIHADSEAAQESTELHTKDKPQDIDKPQEMGSAVSLQHQENLTEITNKEKSVEKIAIQSSLNLESTFDVLKRSFEETVVEKTLVPKKGRKTTKKPTSENKVKGGKVKKTESRRQGKPKKELKETSQLQYTVTYSNIKKSNKQTAFTSYCENEVKSFLDHCEKSRIENPSFTSFVENSHFDVLARANSRSDGLELTFSPIHSHTYLTQPSYIRKITSTPQDGPNTSRKRKARPLSSDSDSDGILEDTIKTKNSKIRILQNVTINTPIKFAEVPQTSNHCIREGGDVVEADFTRNERVFSEGICGLRALVDAMLHFTTPPVHTKLVTGYNKLIKVKKILED